MVAAIIKPKATSAAALSCQLSRLQVIMKFPYVTRGRESMCTFMYMRSPDVIAPASTAHERKVLAIVEEDVILAMKIVGVGFAELHECKCSVCQLTVV